MSADPGGSTRYRFGPLERRGVVAGWRGGQLVALSVGLVLAVLVLRADPTLAGVLLALLFVGMAVAVATWPLGGRTAEEWAPDALRHARTSARARSHRRATPFAALRVLPVEADDGGRCGAVVHDGAARTYTCVLRASGRGFVLLSPDDKVARVDAWSGLLSSLAGRGSAVHRLQWVARCLPDEGVGVRSHFESAAVLDAGSPARRSYGALLESEAGSAHVHEVLLAVTVEAVRAGRAVRAAGGGDRGACSVLLREVASVRRLLADAGVDAGGILSPAAIGDVVRRGFASAPESRAASDQHDGPPAQPVWPWPMAVEGSWARTRVDGTWHATYWIAEWPRREVAPDFLGPLLVSDVRRTVAVVMEPMGALEAARRIEQARTADIADAELRRRGGFLATARRRREEDVLASRETELADGHSQYRFAGYVTVTAVDADGLDDACARTEHAAGRAGLELRRCYGDQARAFTCTLPLGRGLP